jgi:mono/diheme cytochrome c family protein
MRVAFTLSLLAAAVSTGCVSPGKNTPQVEVWPDMKRQAKYKPQAAGEFFADGRTSRTPVAGTVAQGQFKEDSIFSTGLVEGKYTGMNPLKIDRGLLERGEQRFNIHCSPCHSRTGALTGIVGQKALWLPTNLHDARVKGMADGELFQILSDGRRSMPPYRHYITEGDRWAIVAWVRVLQRTTSGGIEEVPPEQRAGLK